MNYMESLKRAALLGLLMTTVTLPTLSEEVGESKGCCGGCCQMDCCAKNNQGLPSGINREDFDLSVSPRDNFYLYAVGGWKKANPIPGDQARWGTFSILADNNTKILNEILEEASKNPSTSLEEKLGKFYASGMDEEAIERSGLALLKSDLQSVDDIRNIDDLQAYIAYMHANGLSPYFSLGSAQDDKDSSRVIATIWQGGLGMPERDYYLRTDDNSKKLRQQYIDYMTESFKLVGYTPSEAKKIAKNIMKFETKLAKASVPAAEMRDPEKMYNLMTFEQLCKLTPSINWAKYYEVHGLSMPEDVNVTTPDFMRSVSKEIADGTSLETHKQYLRWRIINSAAPYVGKRFEELHFNFYNKALRGTKQMKPRWKRVTETIN
ncbi:hypothetical protein IJT10_00725, partial [bacterium]|nr:hypothetical protein [bacterium]